jgi:hypothetical protein
MAKVQNITFDQGANVQIDITIYDTNGDIEDLSGYTATSSFRKHYESVNSTSFVCSTYSNGTLRMTMNAAISANVQPLRYVYDVNLNHTASNTDSRIQEGILIVKPSVT